LADDKETIPKQPSLAATYGVGYFDVYCIAIAIAFVGENSIVGPIAFLPLYILGFPLFLLTWMLPDTDKWQVVNCPIALSLLVLNACIWGKTLAVLHNWIASHLQRQDKAPPQPEPVGQLLPIDYDAKFLPTKPDPVSDSDKVIADQDKTQEKPGGT
jgi:hypothetical protein